MPPIEVWGPWAFGSGGLVFMIFAGVGKFFSYMQSRSASTAITQKELIAGLEKLHEKKEEYSASRIADLESQLRAVKADLETERNRNESYNQVFQRLLGSSPNSSAHSATTPEKTTSLSETRE